jgi:two-component system LytT family sensor kinase
MMLPMEMARPAIEVQRERAERLLNGVRAAVLATLALAALVYAPHIPLSVQRANWLVLIPTLAWSLTQFWLDARWNLREQPLPQWVAFVNPFVDITAVTAILAGYSFAQPGTLALKSPIFLAYFVILAARPIASSTRKAAAAAVLVVVEYSVLVAVLLLGGRVPVTDSPIVASGTAAVSILDEGTKILLLVVAGAIATYATSWHERLAETYYRESQEREDLRVALAQAQLRSLRLQLNPHFLFNTMNGIVALIPSDPRSAERMLTGLSDFLRLSLHNAGEQEVPIEREIQLLERYVMIQQLRFQDRLRISISVDPAANRALVPNLLLQPLAENAIRHGLSPRACGGKLEILAHRQGDTVQLAVIDDGVGCALSAPDELPRGIGLSNIREQLERLYGELHTFAVTTAPNAGFAVRISIPYHTGEELS